MSLAPTGTLPPGSALRARPASRGQAAARALAAIDRDDGDSALRTGFRAVNRSTAWELTSTMALDFPTYHPQGLAVTEDRIFLSSVEIREQTRQHHTPRPGYDRTAGAGVGHLFVLDMHGTLEKDIVLGEGDLYHPGGIDFDGTNVWVPVAQYRPHSSSVIYRVDAETLEVHRQFDVEDHCGGIIMNRQNGHLVGSTWGSRGFVEWNLMGKQLGTWQNPSHFLDYQDGQYVGDSTMLWSGVTILPQAPGGGVATTYELGGVALVDLRSQEVLHEVPFQKWSTAGHVVTHNPFTMSAVGGRLTMRVAPDSGEEGNGTEILTYEAHVIARP